MTFLPIVDRELRAAARRRGTYRVRLLIALMAVVAEIVIFLANFGAPQNQIGQNIFLSLSILCVAFCVFSGRISTADCLSEEKREGTLGLLFLTDLNGYDIVLGKLFSTSLGALYSLLAVMPMLAVPLLMGGVTNGEFWRVALVLVNTFFFSLAIGMFGSAVSRDGQRALAANFGLTVLFVAALPLALFYLSYRGTGSAQSSVLVSSPLFCFCIYQDSVYRAHTTAFWVSTIIVAAQTVLFLALASRIVRHAWQDKPVPPRRTARLTWNGFWRASNYGQSAKLAPFRKELLDQNAFYWLNARARLKPVHVWSFLGLALAWWLANWLAGGDVQYDEVAVLSITLAVIINCTLKAWIALEASRQLAEDQKSGAMELLLATPLTVRDFLRGQFLALRRQFLGPLIAGIIVECVLTPLALWHVTDRRFQSIVWVAGMVMLVADVITLPIVSMRMALTAKNPHRAVSGAVSRVLALPWIMVFIGGGLYTLWIDFFPMTRGGNFYPQSAVFLDLWFWGGLAVDLVMGVRAWRQLTGHFRELATQRFAPPAVRAARQAVSPRFLRRRWILASGAAAALALCAFFALRKTKPDYPPPLEVSITHSNAPFKIFPGFVNYIVLPDGSPYQYYYDGALSLWREGTPSNEAGTNSGWAQISSHGSEEGMALRNDGSLWIWNSARGLFAPVDSTHDWTRMASRRQQIFAIKKDGTLWHWTNTYLKEWTHNSSTNFPAPNQIGRDAVWADVLCRYSYTVGLQTNGTLWIWGQPVSPQTGAVIFPTPTKLCDATNWTSLMTTGLTAGAGVWQIWARNAAGEVWQLTPAMADPTVPPVAIGQLVPSHATPERLAAGYINKPELFEIRDDGSLWERFDSDPPIFVAPAGDTWKRFGTRTDWQKVWGVNGTIFGLTADGTLWLWGVDRSRDGRWNFSMRRQFVKEWFESRGKGGRTPFANGYAPPWLIQETPRPLMHLNYGH